MLDEAENQVVALGLAKLSLERPGWSEYIENIAQKMGIRGHYDSLVAIHSGSQEGVEQEIRIVHDVSPRRS